MIRFLQNLFFGIIAFIALMVVVSFFLPDKYSVEKSIRINAPIDLVFNQVNDLKNWENWSFFFTRDPNWETRMGTWTNGTNAEMKWRSNKIGNGKLTIIESIPNDKIQVHFNYRRRGDGEGTYMFREEDDGTTTVIIRLEFPVPLSPKGKFENIFFEKDTDDIKYEYSLKHLKGWSERKFKEQVKTTGIN